MVETKKNIAIWNSISFIILAVLGFLSFSLNIKTYSAKDFGFYLLLSSVLGVGANLDLGSGVSIVKNISEAVKLNDITGINKLFSSFSVLFVLLSLSISSVIIVYYFFILDKSQFNVLNLQFDIQKLFLILLLNFIIRFNLNFFARIFEGFNEYVVLAKINISITTINTILMLLIFVFKPSILYLALTNLIVSFIYYTVLILIIWYKLKSVYFSVKYISIQTIKKNIAYSLNIQFAFIVGSTIDPILKFLVAKYIDIGFVSYLETAKRLIDITNGLIFSAQKNLMNLLSHANIDKGIGHFVNNELKKYSKMAAEYSVITYGILNPLILFFIYLWFHSFESMMFFLLFLPAYSMINYAGSCYLVLMFEGKGVRLFIIQILNLIFITGCMQLTLYLFGNILGLFGFTIATVLSLYFVFRFLIIKFNLDIQKYFKDSKFYSILKLDIIIILQTIILYLFRDYMFYILISFFGIYWYLFRTEFVEGIQYFWKMFSLKLQSFKK